MPRLYVVLDTNAYISLSDAGLEALIECCARHSIVGVASFWVAQELLSHVADPTDEDFGRARAAIHRLVRHCTQYDGRRSIVRFIGDGYGTVNRELFGRPGPDEHDSSSDYGTLLGVISEATSREGWVGYQRVLDEIKAQALERKREFVEHMWRAVILSHVPDAVSWGAVCGNGALRRKAREYFESPESLLAPAISLVHGASARVGLSLSDEQRIQAIDRAMSLFPTPMHFLRLVAKKIALEGLNLSARANCVFDLQLSYSTSCKAAVDGVPIWFLSADDLLLEAATGANSRRVFGHPLKFRELLQQPRDAILDEIERRDLP